MFYVKHVPERLFFVGQNCEMFEIQCLAGAIAQKILTGFGLNEVSIA